MAACPVAAAAASAEPAPPQGKQRATSLSTSSLKKGGSRSSTAYVTCRASGLEVIRAQEEGVTVQFGEQGGRALAPGSELGCRQQRVYSAHDARAPHNQASRPLCVVTPLHTV